MAFVINGREVDVALGDYGFRLATSQDLPQSVETVPVRKDQLDTEAEPGEQSLADGWWRRSQASFHEGAGFKYQESRTSNDPSSGFWDSDGVDPWKAGELRLQKTMVRFATTSHKKIRACTTSAGASAYATVYSNRTVVVTAAGSNPGTSGTAVPSDINDYAMSGNTFFSVNAHDGVGTSPGIILFQGTVPSTYTLQRGVTNAPNGTYSRCVVGKGRRWISTDVRLYEIIGSIADTGFSSFYQHYVPNWKYTAIATTPAPMLFGGHDGTHSEIQAVSLADDGSVVATTGARTIALLPDGELILSLAVLAGQYVGIGTNKGFRVGVIQGENLTYGPILFEPEQAGWGCRMVATEDRFFLVAGHSRNHVYKVDTGQQLSDGVFPYAKDVYIPEATSGDDFDSIAVVDGRTYVIAAGGLYIESATDYRTSGTLTTGRIRYRTTESKLFKFLELETEPLVGSIAVSLVDQNGVETAVGTAGTAGATRHQITLPNLGPKQQATLKITLNRGTATQTPVLISYQLKALPSVKPQRMIALPLLCYDRETAKSGQRYGKKGYAGERLAGLQALENAGDTVTYKNFLTGESVNVVIDSLRFIETGTAPKQPGFSGRGGVLIAQLRTAET